MKKSTSLASLALLLMAGCSDMTVNVSVLDANYRNAPAFVEARAAHDSAIARTILNSFSDARIRARVREEVSTMVATLQSQVNALPNPTIIGDQDVPRLVNDITDEVMQQVTAKCDPAIDSLRAAVAGVDQAVQIKTPDQRNSALFTASAQLTAALDGWHAARSAATQSLTISAAKLWAFVNPGGAATPTTGPSKEESPAYQNAAASGNTQLASAVGAALPSLSSNDILDDPYASIVINAPNDYWKGIYNQTFGQGMLGDTDIAVRMESVGNFTIKGVRDDASKITNATFQGVGQAVQLAAAIYGVKLPGQTSTTSTTATATTAGGTANGATPASTPASTSAATPSASAAPTTPSDQQALLNSRVAALTLLSTITAHRAAFDTPATQPAEVANLSNAITAVQQAYTQAKTNLGGD